MDTTTLILALLPLAIISLGLEIFALVDLARRDRKNVRGQNKLVWVLIIVLVSTIGSILYLLVGRTEDGEVSNV